MTATATAPRSSRGPMVPLDRHRWVTIRPIESSDADGLFAFYAALSPDSRYTRFLGICRGIDAERARRFASVDHETRDGMVAVVREADGDDGAIVGHACMEPDGADVEEVAFAVADELQGKGIGTALMDQAIRSARRRGVRCLTGSTFAINAPMRCVALHAGPRVTVHAQGAGIEGFDLDLAA